MPRVDKQTGIQGGGISPRWRRDGKELFYIAPDAKMMAAGDHPNPQLDGRFEEMSIAIGSSLGPYKILSPIGAGGHGEVYKAWDTRLSRYVAVKVLPAHLSSNPDLKERFDREARALAALEHPQDRKSTRLNSSHIQKSRMPSSA